MGVLLQGFYKTLPNNAVPAPSDVATPLVPWWWDRLAMQAGDLRLAGFTAVWLPPVLKTSEGNRVGADGYGPFDDYDIGSKDQRGSLETRFGSREQLQRCVASFRAAGIDVYVDMVEHHRSGDTQPFVFRYPGSDGNPQSGRFPKDPLNFIPQVLHDPNLGGPVKDDQPFGRELAPVNGRPRNYVIDNLIDAADWLTRSLGIQGYRLDDVKGLSTDFLRRFLDAKAMQGKFAVGEFFDGNRVLVEGWAANPGGMAGRSHAFDFPLKFVLNAMCNSPGSFNMAMLDHVGLTGIDPALAVTFVENHDTDRSENRIVTNKALGYAYVLTSEGYPCVYYRDYSTDVGCYGLKPQIDNLIWVHEKLANGPTQQRFLDQRLFVYERLGAPNLLVGLNSDTNERSVTVATTFGSGVTLHDYTGHGPDVVTDGGGNATLTVPPNVNGAGYVCYSRAGIGGGFALDPQAVTQEFEGASDLDLRPAMSTGPVVASRVWCTAGTPIRATLHPDTKDWTAATRITLDLLDPAGNVVATTAFQASTPPGTTLASQAAVSGFHSFRLTTAGTPATNANPAYRLSVTYTGDVQWRLPATPVTRALTGEWGPLIPLKNVAIHTHLLPTGKVLYWGRRKNPQATTFESLNEWETHSFVLDPQTGQSVPTGNGPTDKQGKAVNLFCSGHTFLPDGRLMVVGGHLFDGQGHHAVTIYDPTSDAGSAADAMADGRWYPSAITLADGSVMVCSGSFADGVPAPVPHAPAVKPNNTPEVWAGGPWKPQSDFHAQTGENIFLYPRFHLAPDGRVFMAGAAQDSFFFDTAGQGTWTPAASRKARQREYAPSVMYEPGKVLYMGGGNAADATKVPTNVVEKIDLNLNPASWSDAAPMHFPRRQHNATLLPDGSVLVTGGTRGGGGLGGNGFNDLSDQQPVHEAELWDPAANTWTILAREDKDRCYHSTAVLLPDGTVLSAGGGEYQPTNELKPNDASATHQDAQVFSPPYLFKEGKRPTIAKAPDEISYGTPFDVATPDFADIGKASLVRLSSVTHSFNANQRINFMPATPSAGGVTLTAPPNANVCPPGHYLLFLLSKTGVPSVAKIVKVIGQPKALSRIAMKILDPAKRNADIIAAAKRPEVVVGLTATCPYGLAACWGGAYAGLQRLDGVETVRPIADNAASVAFLYLNHDGLPDIAKWPAQFARSANGSYGWRGVEITLRGTLEMISGQLFFPATPDRPRVALKPLLRADKIQIDQANGQEHPLPLDEANAYTILQGLFRTNPTAVHSVTGPLKLTPSGVDLQVRRVR